MSMNGIDISNWQKDINAGAVPADFVIVKATQGTTYVSPSCDRQYHQAKSAGKLLGVYHYASGGGAVAEADFFLKNIQGYLKEAILVLDWEKGQNAAWEKGVTYAKEFLDRVYNKTGIKPLIYMSKSVCREYDWTSVVNGDYGLWVAQYANYNPTGYQTNPWTDDKGYGAWEAPVIFQYSSSGRLTGYNGNLDINIAYMDKEAWGKYAKGIGTSKPTHVNPPENKPNSPSNNSPINFTYSVRIEGGKILPAVTNLADYAGIRGKRITDIAIKCDKGSIWYQVHVLGGGWLPKVIGYNWNDHNNGYAGNGKPIDAVRVYYNTPQDIANAHGYQKAQYHVSPVNGNYYSWQYDDETSKGQDGYAGCFGKSIDRFQLF